MTPGPGRTIGDRDLPQLYLENDRSALSRQSESFRATRLQLLLLMAATATAVVADQVNSALTAALAAGMYAATIVMGVHISRRQARAHWQAHRDVAEFMKSLAWQYMVHGGPFHAAVPDPDALFAQRLEDRLFELRKVGWADPRSAPQIMAGGGQITPAMRSVRARPFEARREIYLRDRLLDQLTWYHDKSTRSRHAAAQWSAGGALLTLLALITAVLRAAGAGLGGWDLTGLLAAAAATCVGWLEIRRHRPLAYAHALVEQDLEALRAAVATTVGEEQWARTVADAERLVSPQHTDWLARFGD